ncbi:MAG: hypothetical protein ACOH2V_14380 [Candidatus Saccharimonadaceae bacterium]
MEKIIKLQERDVYISPKIEVVEIEIEQNILQASSGEGDLPGNDMEGEDW